jgi:hypothetical protein
MFNNFFSPENRAVYEILWKNVVEPGKTQITIWRMRIACWITKVTNTHSEYVIFIAFPRQQFLHERASLLRYTFAVSLVLFSEHHCVMIAPTFTLLCLSMWQLLL